MAYYRPGMQVQPSPAKNTDSNGFSVNTSSSKEKADALSSRAVTVFGIDITKWSPVCQYITLAVGLIVFMCLYGYFQELVQYGWFDKKLSLFSTLLHFIGVSVFAQIQRNMSSHPHKIKMSLYSFTSMGTASPRIAFLYYFLLVAVKVMAQGMSNLCMTEINYPAKVLFKSANPIITMVIGVLWFRKSYPIRDYIVVTLLVVGLYIFIVGDQTGAGMPSATALGVFYVLLSMFGSAGVPMIQEHCIVVYNASVEDLLYHSFVGSAIISLVLSIVTGELFEGINFLLQNSSIHVWLIFIAFCTFGFCGANFGTALTAQYGALVNGITSTLRKAITLTLSFVLFPDRNTMSSGKFLGAAIFFSGLLFRVFSKADGKESKDSPRGGGGVKPDNTRSIPNDYLNMPFGKQSLEDPDDEDRDSPSAVYLDMEDELMLLNPNNRLYMKSHSSDKGGVSGNGNMKSVHAEDDPEIGRLISRIASNSAVHDSLHL